MATTSPSPASQPHVLALPLPAQGHINPLMRLCKILASNGCLITFVNIDPIHNRSQSLQQQQQQQPSLQGLERDALLPRIRRAHVPVDGFDMENDFRISMKHIGNAVDSMGPALEQLVQKLSEDGTPVTFLISDFFTSIVSQKVADKLRIPRIAFFPASQSYSLFCYYLSHDVIDVDNAIQAGIKRKEYPDVIFQEALPGLPALRIADVPTFKHVFDENEYLLARMARQCKIAFDKAHGVVVNSFDELEAPSLEALRKLMRSPIYPLGPLIENLTGETNTSLWKEETDCLDWLQNQAPQSVLYISFGSITLLSKLQIEEILTGLEASNQNFLWVFRPDLVEGATYSSLPADFLERTKNRGYVVRWAPQINVLSHPSVGGFLTHCGWNSTIEGVANGVPMLCWPYFLDQFMNAKYIVEEWEIGLRFKEGKDGLVSAMEVEKQVKALMKGGEVLRKNAAQLKEAGRSSLQAGGSSRKNVKALVEALKSYHPQ